MKEQKQDTALMVFIGIVFALMVIFTLVYLARAGELEDQLTKIQAERQKLVQDYRIGQLMMENAQLKDQSLAAQEQAVKAQIDGTAKAKAKAETKEKK